MTRTGNTIVFDTFVDVMRTVVDHVIETGHQNILLADDPERVTTGYACQDCPYFPTLVWMAPASSVHDLKGKYHDFNLTFGQQRMELGRLLVKEGLGFFKGYRPTSWERILSPPFGR